MHLLCHCLTSWTTFLRSEFEIFEETPRRSNARRALETFLERPTLRVSSSIQENTSYSSLGSSAFRFQILYSPPIRLFRSVTICHPSLSLLLRRKIRKQLIMVLVLAQKSSFKHENCWKVWPTACKQFIAIDSSFGPICHFSVCDVEDKISTREFSACFCFILAFLLCENPSFDESQMIKSC